MSIDMQWNFMNPQNTMEADIAAKKARAAAQMQGYQTAPMNAALQGYHPNMISQPYGQIAPDMDGYGKEMEAASAQLSGQLAREKKIVELESQISALEQSIAEKTAQLQNWTGNADKIAAIEASKINASDPTMIWRWNEGRKDAERQAEINRIASKAREEVDNKAAQEKFKNTVDMLVGQRTSTTPAGMEQQLRNIEATIRDGKNISADVSMLEKRKKEIEDSLYGNGQPSGEFNASNAPENLKATVQDFLNKKNSSEEISKFIDEHPKLDNEDRIKLNTAFRDALGKENASANEAAFRNWAKKKGYNVERVDQQFLKSLRAAYKREKGK